MTQLPPRIPRTKTDLSPARRRLVNLFLRINFGRIEDLIVRDGEPVFDPATRVIREVKMAGGDNGMRSELLDDNYALRPQHLELMRVLDEVRDGTIPKLECKHGVPFYGEVLEPV